MTAKKISGLILVFIFSLSLLAAFAEALPAAQRPPQKKAPAPQERIIIPKDIQAVLQEGLVSRQGRQDIPFEIFKIMAFPAQQISYPVLFFKAKNSDLGFIPSADAAQPGLEARLNVFIQFRQEDASGVPQIAREAYVPFVLQQDLEGYDPEKTEWYSFGYPLVPGKYIVAMAITSTDLTKVGVCYSECVLPGPETYQAALETSPIFFAKNLETMQTPEQGIVIHKGAFTYGVLKIVPSIDDSIAAAETFELFYFIYGAKPLEGGEPTERVKNDIDVSYVVNKDDDSIPEDERLAIRWEKVKYDLYLISQPLFLKQTVTIKDDKGERTEQRDLEPGKYILVINITDNVSGLSLEKKFPFEVKQAE